MLEGSVEELLVTEANPEEPGQHRITGIHLGRDISLSVHKIALTKIISKFRHLSLEILDI